MLTTEGKNHIRRYLAGWVPAIAQTVAFGVGSRAESLSDIALQMETIKSPVNLTSYDFVNNVLVYKASVPDDYAGKIYEVGIYSLEADPAAGEFSSRTLTIFDYANEDWINVGTGAAATFTAVNNRVGLYALSATTASSTTETFSLRNVLLDLSGYSNADTFNFAYNVANANTSNIKFRFLTDSANYYEFALGSQTTGYKITEVAKGTATVTGTPNWTNITEIQVIVTSGAGGASSIEFDAIRVEDKDSLSLDYILVARKVLAVPATSVLGQAQDLEFTLDVTV